MSEIPEQYLVRITGPEACEIDLRPAVPLTYGDMKVVQKCTGASAEELASNPERADGALLHILNKALRTAGKPEIEAARVDLIHWDDVPKILNVMTAEETPEPDPTN